MDQNKPVEPRFALLAAAFAAAVVYGSLFPFEYRPGPGALRVLLSTTRYVGTPFDVISNVVFYVPLGLLAARSLLRPAGFARVWIATFCGFALSAGVELTQAHIATRLSNLSDIYANTAGTFAGACIAAIWPRVRARLGLVSLHLRPYPAMLLITWMGARIFSYEPPADASQLGFLARRMFDFRILAPADLFHWWALWLVIACLMGAIAGETRRRFWLFGIFCIATVAGQLLFSSLSLSPAELWAAVLLLPFLPWILPAGRGRASAGFVAAAVTLDVILDALRPFHFAAAARSFGLTPFQAFFDAPSSTRVTAMFQKVFAYGALIWIWIRAGVSWRVSAILGTALVLALRMIQVYLPGRSAEVTDAIMVLVMAVVLKLLREEPDLS